MAEGHNYMMPNIYSHYVTMACMCVYVKVCVCVGMCYDTAKPHHSLLWQKGHYVCYDTAKPHQFVVAEGHNYMKSSTVCCGRRPQLYDA